MVRRDFDPGCGCLGLLLFGWVGVLLGLLGGGDAEIVCRNCGTKWPPGNPGGARRGGCLGLLLVSIMIILALSFLGRSR